ncbi:hypothetical protein Q75_01545 [Bacillus coahuilensis p1.1.43]|uniref:STAS domain-containing protein n=1 Tax=Bacillus coahuilensis p1.1.43 TaxID=1150625 RepID=A0A147KC43_9BACI|nr:STAS domain-containing protein [Bacillus coahuilensis]KUP09145.1 hypothetical protein Q75_01545 [Bacillus coahuilensis p1.1.43]
MNDTTQLLHDFLIDHTSEFTEKWFSFQEKKTGSHYSVDAPPEIKERIKHQNGNYLRLLADCLVQDDEMMKATILNWTQQTGKERAESNTDLTEVLRNNALFRRTLWEMVETFCEENQSFVTLKDVFYWEKKLNKSLDYVIETFSDTFLKIMISRLESQANLIYELTAPVITITDQLGLLPIIGEIDTNRTKHILESTLKQVAELHLSTLIIDLSGVIMIDTMVAQRLFQMVEALKLLGTKTVISGIRPEVALTSVQLGIDFTALETSANLRTLIAKYI